MAQGPLPFFDAHLHPQQLPVEDLETMRFFGLRATVAVAQPPPVAATSREIVAHFSNFVRGELARLENSDIRAYAAVGVDPRCVPQRGLFEVLSALPEYFHGGKVVAIGEIGLHRGGPVEEEAFTEQLKLARRLKLRVLVHAPQVDKERHTRRILTLLRASGLPPQQVLVDHAHPSTLRPILECGHYAGLTIHPDELKAERACALIQKIGSERIILNTDSGMGAGDILGLARAIHLMEKAKLSARVIERASFKNAADFFGVDANFDRA